MGLETNILANNGIEKSYLRVSKNIFYQPEEQRAEVQVLIYLNEEARINGANPLVVKNFLIKNETILVDEEVPITIEQIKFSTPYEEQIKFEDVPIYEVIWKNSEEFITELNPEGKYSVTTDKVIGYEKTQFNLTDQELLEKFSDKTFTKQVAKEFKFFDEFKEYFENGEYVAGVYNFLATHPKIQLKTL